MTELLALIGFGLNLGFAIFELENRNPIGFVNILACVYCITVLLRCYWETKEDTIKDCVENNDLRGLIEYAYYLANIEISVSEGIKNGKYGKIYGWLLMRYCDYRMTKTVMTMFDHFNLSLDEIKERVNQFMDEKISEVMDYDG